MQKEIALSFRHFNLIWPNIPCNSSIVMNLLTDLLDGIGSLSGKRISVLFFFFSFATNAKNSKCIDCGRIVKLWHEYYFVLEIKQ